MSSENVKKRPVLYLDVDNLEWKKIKNLVGNFYKKYNIILLTGITKADELGIAKNSEEKVKFIFLQMEQYNINKNWIVGIGFKNTKNFNGIVVSENYEYLLNLICSVKILYNKNNIAVEDEVGNFYNVELLEELKVILQFNLDFPLTNMWEE